MKAGDNVILRGVIRAVSTKNKWVLVEIPQEQEYDKYGSRLNRQHVRVIPDVIEVDNER